MRRHVLSMLAAMAIVVMVCGPQRASADTVDNQKDACATARFGQERIDACTWLILSGQLSDDDVAVAFNNRGNAYDDHGQYRRAIRDFDQSIRLKSDYADTFFNRGNAYDDLGKHQRAIKDYDQAISLKPDYVQALYNRGNAYYDLGQFQRALQDYDQAISLKPDYVQALYNRGRARLKVGDAVDGDADIARAKALGFEP